MTPPKEWIDIKIEDGSIKYFEYNNFSKIVEEIGKGAFGIVYKASWNDSQIALKS